MNLRFAFLCDYAGPGHQGKLIIVGIYDTVYDQGARPIPVPLSHLIMSIEAHVTEGGNHQLRVVLTNADGKTINQIPDLPLKFGPQGPGRPLVANALLRLAGLAVPDRGEYSFNLLVDGRHVGAVSMYVTGNAPAR